MYFSLAHALLPPSGCSVHFRSVASAAAPVFSLAALCLLPVVDPVHFPSLGRLSPYRSPAKSGQVFPRSVRPLVLPVPPIPRFLESVPLPVAEFRRPMEPVPSPVAPDATLLRVFPMSRPVLPPQPHRPRWFPDGSSVQRLAVPVPVLVPAFAL